MHLALVVMLREFQQIGIRLTGPHMNEYVTAAAIIIALLLLRRLRKRSAFGAQRELTGLPMRVVVVCRIRSHSPKLNLASSLDV